MGISNRSKKEPIPQGIGSFLYSENHSPGEWFRRSLLAMMKKREEQMPLYFAQVSG